MKQKALVLLFRCQWSDPQQLTYATARSADDCHELKPHREWLSLLLAERITDSKPIAPEKQFL